MLDINLLRTNPEVVKENIKKKFQNQKLELVDKVVELDRQFRKAKTDGDSLRPWAVWSSTSAKAFFRTLSTPVLQFSRDL